MKPRKSAFTLIELLVVISIIALLVSILLPALQMAKRKAGGAVCLVHQKGIALAWVMYAQDNKDLMVGSSVEWRPELIANGSYKINWVYKPEDEQGNPAYTSTQGWLVPQGLWRETEIWGIRRGKLYPYTESDGVYHCPTDSRDKNVKGFRTYSMAGGLNGEADQISSKQLALKKTTQINQPSEKYITVEEPAPGWNAGSWLIFTPEQQVLPVRYATDPVATWHGGGTVMNFCDGHAETHIWQDPETVTNAELGQQGGTILWNGDILGDNDYLWMKKHYAYNEKNAPPITF
jgi:prepilin-type N-terminal cleavage/methylation domain-containing protein/prepilin-type processing-associated H-X9-DG protein